MNLQEVQQAFENFPHIFSEVREAAEQHDRMLFYWTYTGHDAILNNGVAGVTSSRRDGWPHFMAVKRILDSDDKYTRYCQKFKNPLPELLTDVMRTLKAATRAIDRFEYVEFASEASQNAWAEYSKEYGKKLDEFFNDQAIFLTHIAPSCILVVATKEDGTPYCFQPDLHKVRAYILKGDGSFKFLAFMDYEGNIHTYCDQFYRVFAKEDDKLTSPIYEQPHGIGYCPAKFLYNTPATSNEHFPRRTPSTTLENELNEAIQHETMRAYYEMFAKYPIMSRIAEKCTYTKFGKTCNGKYFEWQDDDGVWQKEACSCDRTKFIGPGSEISVTLQEGQTSLPDVVKIVGADVPTLEYNAARTKEFLGNIEKILCGGTPEGINNKAVNEKQVSGVFEARKNVISELARQLEQSHAFVLETYARLMFNDFVSCTVDYGVQFQIVSKDYLTQELTNAKASGAGPGKIIALKKQISMSEATTNAEADRLNFLELLSDFPDLTTAEIMQLATAGNIDSTTLIYNISLPRLIAVYEREFGQLTGKEDLSKVKSKLLSYVNFNENAQNSTTGSGSTAPAASSVRE